MNNRTVISFDFGKKNIGAAIGQELIRIPRALTAFKSQSGSPNWQDIAKLLQEWKPNILIVGLPLNMDGSEQPVTKQARKFAKHLYARFGIQTVLHDERLSTVEARAYLFNRGGYRALDKSSIDATSAAVILESWFQYHQS
ncbi:Holliday junction resolvase RuvX [Candidatus Gillettellia adelgis]